MAHTLLDRTVFVRKGILSGAFANPHTPGDVRIVKVATADLTDTQRRTGIGRLLETLCADLVAGRPSAAAFA